MKVWLERANDWRKSPRPGEVVEIASLEELCALVTRVGAPIVLSGPASGGYDREQMPLEGRDLWVVTIYDDYME